jgi:hypothetical protein
MRGLTKRRLTGDEAVAGFIQADAATRRSLIQVLRRHADRRRRSRDGLGLLERRVPQLRAEVARLLDELSNRTYAAIICNDADRL